VQSLCLRPSVSFKGSRIKRLWRAETVSEVVLSDLARRQLAQVFGSIVAAGRPECGWRGVWEEAPQLDAPPLAREVESGELAGAQ
jgi:hypothetical protein